MSMTLIPLTNEQQRKWEDTCSMMAWQCPGFRHLFYKLLNAQDNTDSEYVAMVTRDIPIAATDGKNILINPDTFFNYKLSERVFIIGHEVLHNVLEHVGLCHRWVTNGKVTLNDGTALPYDDPTMQVSMDEVINAVLVESKIGKMPKDAIFEKGTTSATSILDVYKRRYKKYKGPGGGQPGDQPGKGEQQGFDQVLPPGAAAGQDPQQAADARNPQQWESEIATAAAIEAMRAQGRAPSALQKLLQDILEPKVFWLDHIETLIKRVCGGDNCDWAQPNPWLGTTDSGEYFVPADTGCGAGWIVIWEDTSGSRNEEELRSARGETAGILEQVNPRRVTLISSDCELYEDAVYEITDMEDLKTLQVKGGGGTSYKPVLDWIKAQGETPDLFIGFTDGYVDHPECELPYPVIWASSTDQGYPFGQVVRVNKRAG